MLSHRVGRFSTLPCVVLTQGLPTELAQSPSGPQAWQVPLHSLSGVPPALHIARALVLECGRPLCWPLTTSPAQKPSLHKQVSFLRPLCPHHQSTVCVCGGGGAAGIHESQVSMLQICVYHNCVQIRWP